MAHQALQTLLIATGAIPDGFGMIIHQLSGPVGIGDQLTAHRGGIDPAAFDRLVDELGMTQIADADHRFIRQRFDLTGKFREATFGGKTPDGSRAESHPSAFRDWPA